MLYIKQSALFACRRLGRKDWDNVVKCNKDCVFDAFGCFEYSDGE